MSTLKRAQLACDLVDAFRFRSAPTHHRYLKSILRDGQFAEHVLNKGYSIDSTHTEPYANRHSHGLRTFDEFVTTALQHNLVIGKGGFAVSFYVLH
jgi:hypothetical protein